MPEERGGRDDGDRSLTRGTGSRSAQHLLTAVASGNQCGCGSGMPLTGAGAGGWAGSGLEARAAAAESGAR